MKEKLEYLTIKFFLWAASWMPKSVIYFLTKVLSIFFYFIMQKRRLLTQNNLKKAFPSLTEKEIHKYSKEIYLNISETVAEILLMFVDRFDIDDAIINLDEAIDKLSKCKSKNGTIFMGAHFSNWELMAQFLAKHGFPTLVIGRKGDNKLIDANITTPFRNKFGNKSAHKSKAMIAMAKTLKNGGSVGVLIDQKTGGTHASLIEFFGSKAKTTLSVASLKLKFDSLVIPISVVRESRGKYHMYIDDAIEYKAEDITDEREKLEAMTLRYNQAIEKIILRSIPEWFWMHDRWK